MVDSERESDVEVSRAADDVRAEGPDGVGDGMDDCDGVASVEDAGAGSDEQRVDDEHRADAPEPDADEDDASAVTVPNAKGSAWASPADLMGWLDRQRSTGRAHDGETHDGEAHDGGDQDGGDQDGEGDVLAHVEPTSDVVDEGGVEIDDAGHTDDETPDDTADDTADDIRDDATEDPEDTGDGPDQGAVEDDAGRAGDIARAWYRDDAEEGDREEGGDAEPVSDAAPDAVSPDTAPMVLPVAADPAAEEPTDGSSADDAESDPEAHTPVPDTLPVPTVEDEAPPASAPAPSRPDDPPVPDAQPEGDVASAAGRNRLRRRLVLAGAGFVGLLALGVGGATAFAADLVPRGTTIGGVDVGGMRRTEAVQTLTEVAGVASGSPVTVSVAGRRASIDPATAGLSVDAEQSVDAVLGSRFALDRVWRQAVGGAAAQALPEPAEADLREAVEAVAADTRREPVDGQIVFGPDGARAVAAEPGVELDTEAAMHQVSTEWLAPSGVLVLAADVTEPEITQEEVDRAMTEIAVPAASGPVTVELRRSSSATPSPSSSATPGTQTTTVTRAALLPALSMVASDEDAGRLDLAVDGAALRSAVLAGDETLETSPKDARIVLKDGAPQVLPSVTGVGIDPDEMAAAVRESLLDGDRTARVEARVLEPELTTQEAKALGVKERVSRFSTNYPSNAPRTNNLRIAARTVNGTLVLPGETFSLNEVLGPRTPDKGYAQAPVIYNGRLQMDYGGGVSQMATTIFNNVFFSGLEDVQHMPHSFYISRYPEGREATVDYPSVDLKWRNDSPYGVLVEASVTDTVNVSFWSTEQYDDVQAIKSARSNIRQPGTVYDERDGCVPQSPAQGFDVAVRRKVIKDGEVVKDQTWRTTYVPEDRVICGPKPTPTPTPTPKATPTPTATALARSAD